MGASYNFEEKDNSNKKFVKRIQLTRLGLILLLITSGVQILSSILTIPFASGLDEVNVVILILELFCFLTNVPALVMLLFGLDELRDKIDNTKKSLLRFAVIFLGIYLGFYIISTIVMIIVTFASSFFGAYLVSKNLMCFIFIAISLVFISLAFNKMNAQGYPTKLLLSPLISLPLIASAGFIFGWTTVFNDAFKYGGGGAPVAMIIVIYLSIAQLVSILELFLSFNKVHNDVLLNLAPELLHTKENKKKVKKKKVEQVVKAEKAVAGK